MTPPGIAWMMRKTIIELMSHASPQSADPAPNATSAPTYARPRPSRSPNHALAGTITPRASEYAVETHWIWSVVAPKSFCIDGIATLTMLTSSTDMNMPVTRTSSDSSQGVAEPRAGAAAGAAAGADAGGDAGEGRSAVVVPPRGASACSRAGAAGAVVSGAVGVVVTTAL